MNGIKTPETTTSITNILEFWWNQKTLGLNTFLPVKVIEVNENNTVDIEIMIRQLDADNKVLEPLTVYNCPYMTNAGGTSALIMKPVKDDIGIVAFCQRDISTFVETKENKAPNTLRRFSLSDAIYLGRILVNESDCEQTITLEDNSIVLQTTGSTISLGDSIVCESDTIDITSNDTVTIDGTKVVTTASSVNAITELKDTISTLANACALPTAPGQPVITPADLILIQTALAKLDVFE